MLLHPRWQRSRNCHGNFCTFQRRKEYLKLSEVEFGFLYITSYSPKQILTTVYSTGAPRLLRLPRPGPCLKFGLQVTLYQTGGQIILWALSGSNSQWRPCSMYCSYYPFRWIRRYFCNSMNISNIFSSKFIYWSFFQNYKSEG